MSAEEGEEEDEEDAFAEKIVGKTMCEAADEGSMEEIKLALWREEGIDVQDPENGDSCLMKAIKGGYLEIARLILDVGININLANFFGDTALHWACTRGFEDLVVELVHRGAHINAQGEYKNTPLHLACSNNQEAIASFLLMEGADVTIRNEFGNDPLVMCANHKIKVKVKAVKDEGDAARERMKKELKDTLEERELKSKLEKMKQEKEEEQKRQREAWIKSKVDEVLAAEKKIDDEEAAIEAARQAELKRIEDERIAAELAAIKAKEKKAAKKAKKKGKKK
ncbi:hypothetical protein KC19_8G122600 [Ceratodon purpureus]|uniref:Uncharacterized protein n=1 Tax=Ceratodon purpureus TaxID=3225 RepID=A0A8T0GXS8_CERPU|nr:hypothetical protein KC19_8G122600 [Ceratodon purpureus]KAG0564581.1 hypothetical protein KC19_8G122600 [Ceratodon purpureus]